MTFIEPVEERTLPGPEPVATTPDPVVAEPVEEVVEETPESTGFESLPESWQKEIHDLRQEAAARRTAQKEFDSAFDGYTQEEKAAYLEYARLVRAANSGDQAAAIQLQELLSEEEEEESTPEFTPEYFRQLAREEAANLFAEQQAQQAQVRAVSDVQSTAKDLGYQPGSEDYLLLLHYANQMEAPDLKAAHEQVKNYHQTRLETYLKEKEAEADRSPSIGTGNGVAPATFVTPKTWKEARESTDQRLQRL